MGTIEDMLGQVFGQPGASVATAAQPGTVGQPGQVVQPDQAGGDLLTGVLAQALGTNEKDANPILVAIMQFVQKNGGVSGIIEKLRKSGLADQVSSWIGTGANQAVTPQQIGEVFGSDSIGGFAKDLNVTPEKAEKTLADALPALISQFSPEGALPENAGDLLSMFSGMLGSPKA